jgi:putative transposase
MVLTGDIAEKLRDLIREICVKHDVEIIRGLVSKDHVHLFVSAMPKLRLHKFIKLLKGSTSHKLMKAFPSLEKQYWGRQMRACGYLCCTNGNITDEMIKKYIENQPDDEEEGFKLYY